ncbi:hypothetical protein JOL79_24215 [Microbispora sp. RL4-1S]|uniref:VCBS repeat-containing protein n=1 Tax=Microbispora oryzae TaxID=2806554 RepID=A0A941AL72_9ACTN|nr:hypothetical protein [Microbispora oryzae]MBP2706917.1 hypothetical protein [Microbispora oryzae]
MHTRTGMATSAQRPCAGDALYVRDRSTGELFGYPHRPGVIDPGSYGVPALIGVGFLPGVSPVLAAGDFQGDGGLGLLCGLPGGREVVLPPADMFTAAGLPPAAPAAAPATQAVVVRSGAGRPDQVLRAAPDGTVWLSPASVPHGGEPLTTIGPGAVLLGMGDVTGAGRPELLVRRPDGGVGAFEFRGAPGGGIWHDLGADFDDAVVVAAADASGDGMADLLAVDDDGELLVFPHSGVFWPQDPAVTFLSPVPVALAVGAFDVIG